MPMPTPPSVPPPGRGRPRVAGQRRLARQPRDLPDAPQVEVETGVATAGETGAEPVLSAEPATLGPPVAAPVRSWLVPATLGAVIALLATLSGILFAVHHAGQHRLAVADARSAARIAAAQGLTAVLSYDYSTFDADVARGKRHLTPRFGAKYVTEQNRVVKETAIKAKAKVVADVSAVGVVDASPHEVHLLAFVTQTSTTKSRPTPRADRSRILVTMDEVGGRWLIAGITPI